MFYLFLKNSTVVSSICGIVKECSTLVTKKKSLLELGKTENKSQLLKTAWSFGIRVTNGMWLERNGSKRK